MLSVVVRYKFPRHSTDNRTDFVTINDLYFYWDFGMACCELSGKNIDLVQRIINTLIPLAQKHTT